MPEMKRNFTKGKMNKDLDERLVPNGEYRDAMNIQVSTSEGSDVGTIQNVLGNTPGCDVNFAPAGSYTVGSISDEKNDTLYWLVSGQEILQPEMSDMILRRKIVNGQGICEPVFVDKFAFAVPNPGITTDVNSLDLLAGGLLDQIYDGWTVNGVTANGSVSNTVLIEAVTVGDSFQFNWEFAVSTTPSYSIFCVGSNLMCGATDLFVKATATQFNFSGDPIQWVVANNQQVFLENYISGNNLVGSWIDVDPYTANDTNFGQGTTGPSGDLWEITAQSTGNLLFTDAFGNNTTETWEILTLDTPFTLGGLFSGTFGSNQVGNKWVGFGVYDAYINVGTILGNTPGIITELIPVYNNVPDDGWITLPPAYTASAYTVNDPITLNPNTIYSFDGCINAIDVNGGNNMIQVVDCGNNLLFAEPYQYSADPNNPQWVPTGDIVISDSLVVDFGSQQLNLSGDNYVSFVFQGPRVLNFNHGDLILGLNIVDDFLFWTDNKTEPKKISISRSIAGTDPTAIVHTDLMLPSPNGSLIPGINRGPAREEHITVIRKAPHTPPTLKMTTELREGSIGDGYTLVNMDANNLPGTVNYFSNIEELLYVSVFDVDGEPCDFVVGDTIGLADATYLASGDVFSEGYQITLNILEINFGPWTNPNASNQTVVAGETAYLVEVITIADSANPIEDNWYFELVDDDNFLFERKLPRFAYRYKYVDNEYSSYGPFSDVAFEPGTFQYEPVKAYNEGMTNTVRSLTIQDFVPSNIPKDVVQIDILYKNEYSPIVYLMDSIRENDAPLLANAWNAIGSQDFPNVSKGSYKITTENIYAALPANQSLRAWDNVPRLALGQEISGNRIIYGNYVQGYNIEEVLNDLGGKMIPKINVSLLERSNLEEDIDAHKSIKSLRNYDLGVVWGDKYGRETPVITPSTGSIVVPKIQANKYNYFAAELDKSPHWAEYYRYYIKETSNEYYNLAVDRIYDAEDGNIWVSFPSVDRNKIDEDTYIILKKGCEPNDNLVEEKARYKVVAIENEAPEYIKTDYEQLARSNTDSTRYQNSCQIWGGGQNLPLGSNLGCGIYPTPLGPLNPPVVGRKSFSINKDHWNGDWSVLNNTMGLPDLKKLFTDINADNTSDEFYVSFTKETIGMGGSLNVITGSKYRVLDVLIWAGDGPNDATTPENNYDFSSVEMVFDPPGPTIDMNAYEIKLSEPIKSTDDFVVDAYDANGNLFNDNIHVIFWKKTISNKPEFDGRFFAKIYADGNDREYLAKTPDTITNWIITAATNIYKIEQSFSYSNIPTESFNHQLVGAPAVGSGPTSSVGDWDNLLKFGGNNVASRWFIDGASFASRVQTGSSSAKSVVTNHAYSGGLNASCDRTSNQPFTTKKFTGMQSSISSSNLAGWPHNVSFSENVGNGKSYGRVGMKGAWEDGGGAKFLDLSFSKINPTKDTSPDGRQSGSSAYHVNWGVGANSNPYHDEEKSVIDGMNVGRRFRLRGVDIIYKVISTTIFNLFNFQGAITADFAYKWVANYGNSGHYWHNQHTWQLQDIHKANNRRKTYRIQYEVDWEASDQTLLTPALPLMPSNTTPDTLLQNPVFTAVTNLVGLAPGATVTPAQIEFLSEFNVSGENEISTNPAIFETEPKEDADLDLYYEASSSFPTLPLKNSNKEIFIPLGTIIVIPPALLAAGVVDGTFVSGWLPVIPYVPNPWGHQVTVLLSAPILMSVIVLIGNIGWPIIEFLRDDGTYVKAKLAGFSGYGLDALGNGIATEMVIIPQKSVGLSWHNCWSFGNGVESNRIGDTYNKPFLTNGVAVSSIIEDNFKEEHKKYSLIYSGLYNSNSGINNLNQFIAGEQITKDLNPTYGSIQKLKAGWGQGGDLIALCEDRVLKILADKDALYNADGSTNVTATNRVLGTATPYSGEYGISKNPESFASEAYRAYFTDKVRGAVMRLSRDGLTPISDANMKDWFRDNLKLSDKLVGSYDDKKDEYNITLEGDASIISRETPGHPTTVTFKEDVKGWVSFKSFVTQNAISCANEYFSFLGGELWMHHHDVPGNRNTFYNIPKPSTLNVLLNDAPELVKSFYTLNYEGSNSRVTQFTTDPTTGLTDGQYHNLTPTTPGWYVDSIKTNKESGHMGEFIEKEGKWFNYLKGNDIIHNTIDSSIIVNVNDDSSFDQAGFAIQGLGALSNTPPPPVVNGCMDCGTYWEILNGQYCDGVAPAATLGSTNYNPLATVDDGTCIPAPVILGCIDTSFTAPNSDCAAGNTNYPCSDGVNTDNGSCFWLGCTDATAFNYVGFSPAAQAYIAAPGAGILDDGSCVPFAYGCMDPTMENFDANANTEYPTSNCVPFAYGCVGQVDGNNILVAADNAINQDPTANTDNGTCQWAFCGETLDASYNLAAYDESVGNAYVFTGIGYVDPTVGCTSGGCMDATAVNYTVDVNGDAINSLGNVITWDDGSCIYPISGCTYGMSLYNNNNNGNIPMTFPTWNFQIQDGGPEDTNMWIWLYEGPPPGPNPGPDPTMTASNYDPNASYDDGSCVWCSGPMSGAFGNGTTGCGCTDPTASNYDPTALYDDGSCVYVAAVMGCMDAAAINYDPTATIDDGSCIAACGLANISSITVTQPSAGGVADGEVTICFSAPYPITQFTNSIYPTPQNQAITNYPNWVSTGCSTYSGFEAGTFLIEVTDGYGCVMISENITFNYYGCMDPSDVNYDSLATVSDGSCTLCDANASGALDWDVQTAMGLSYIAGSTVYVEYPTASGIYWQNYYVNNVIGCNPGGNGITYCGDGTGEAEQAPGGYGGLWLACTTPTTSCDGSNNLGAFSAGIALSYIGGDVVLQSSNGFYYAHDGTANPNGWAFEPGEPNMSSQSGTPWVLCSPCNNCP